jgi:hypothetical protein
LVVFESLSRTHAYFAGIFFLIATLLCACLRIVQKYLTSVIIGYFTSSQFLPVIIEALTPYLQRKYKAWLHSWRMRRVKRKDAKDANRINKETRSKIDVADDSDEEGETVDKDGLYEELQEEMPQQVAGISSNRPKILASSPDKIVEWEDAVLVRTFGKPRNSWKQKDEIKFAERKASGLLLRKIRSESKNWEFALIDDYEDLILEFGCECISFLVFFC